MSATNRGAERNARDFYETPAWVTQAILPKLNLGGSGLIWEGAAGGGAIVHELLRAGVESSRIWATDIYPNCEECTFGDYTRIEGFGERVNLAITNPPFRIQSPAPPFVIPSVGEPLPKQNAHDGVLAFIAAANRACAEQIAVLCRLSWWAGGQRRARAREQIRARYKVGIYTMAKRPSFTGKGTDAAEYAWLVLDRRHQRVDWLGPDQYWELDV